MPNWCYTTYHFEGNDVKKLLEIINKGLREHPAEKPKADRSWVGDIAVASGIETKESIDNTELSLRAFIQDVDLTSPQALNVIVESAWAPMPEMWFRIRDFLSLDMTISYITEEPGFEIYEKHDESGYFADEDWYLDCCLEGKDRELFPELSEPEYYSDEQMRNIASEFLTNRKVAFESSATTAELVDLLVTCFEEHHCDEDSFLAPHQFEIADLSAYNL